MVNITGMKDISTLPFRKTPFTEKMTSMESSASHEKISKDLRTTSLTTDSATVTSFPYTEPLHRSLSESASMVFSSYSSDQDRKPGNQMETTQTLSPPLTSKSLTDECNCNVSRSMIIIASISGCILFSIIIGLIIKCLLRRFRGTSRGRHLSYMSRRRNHIVREAGMMQMSVINESNSEGIEMHDRLDLYVYIIIKFFLTTPNKFYIYYKLYQACRNMVTFIFVAII